MEESRTPLVPVEEQTIEFYGDQIVAVAIEEEGVRRIYTPVKPITDYLGLDWSSQYKRIQRDAILSQEARLMVIATMNTNPAGGRPDMLCLPLEMLQGFLFGIQPNRVREALREKVLRYQRECYRVLHEAFRLDRSLPERTSEAVIQAMRDNALQQARLWETVLAEQRRLRVTEMVVQEHDDLIGAAFDQLALLRQEQVRLATRFDDLSRLLPAPDSPISPAQKAAIKALVDDIVAAAQEAGVRLGQGRNDYPAVWDAFKRRFDLARYDELPSSRFDEATGWLKSWRDRLTAG